MNTFQTIEEIEAQYAPDWVLIAEPQTDDGQRLLGGVVVHRAQERDELFQKARELGLHHIAIRKLGPWPKDLVLVL